MRVARWRRDDNPFRKGGQGFPSEIHPVPFVRREKVSIFSGCNPHPATFAPAGSNRSGSGGNETAGASDAKGRLRRLREQAGRNVSERRAGLETGNVGADPAKGWGRPWSQISGERIDPVCGPTGVMAMACLYREIGRNTGYPKRWAT
jgi:hypothetical protein